MSRIIKSKIPNFEKSWYPKLKDAGLTEDQISIVVHNFDPLISTKKLGPKTTEKFLTSLINDTTWRRKFFADPTALISEANPQPSP